MKKILLTLLLAGVISLASAQTRVGGFLGYGSDIENLCIGGLGEFFINEKMAISPNLTLFFPKNVGFGKITWWELNANFNYYFIPEGTVSLYGIAGLNFATVKYKYNDAFFNGSSVSNTELGLNLGIGTNFEISNENILPFGELRAVIGDADQVVITFGAKFKLR